MGINKNSGVQIFKSADGQWLWWSIDQAEREGLMVPPYQVAVM